MNGQATQLEFSDDWAEPLDMTERWDDTRFCMTCKRAVPVDASGDLVFCESCWSELEQVHG